MSKIYKIYNNINDKIYIGKTNSSIEERFKEHCSDCLKKEEEKRPLYNAMKKYGIENFFIEEIEDCLPELASEKEIYWIGFYNSYYNGYNATQGGDGKMLYNYSLIAERLKEHPYPKEIAKEFGCCVDTICTIAKNFNIKINHRGQELNVNSKKAIKQFDKDNNYIQTFSSTVEAGKWIYENNKCSSLNSGVRSHISDCANGKRKSAYGYVWRYK